MSDDTLEWPDKDPDAVLDYFIDWQPKLDPVADTIATSTWTLPAGITLHQQGFSDTKTLIWLKNGTAGNTYAIHNRITTAGGRTFDQTVTITVAEK